MDDLSKVTRLEIIDHSTCKNCKGEGYVQGVVKMEECKVCFGLGSPGRSVVFWDANKTITTSLQDEERTLKIFIKERGTDDN